MRLTSEHDIPEPGGEPVALSSGQISPDQGVRFLAEAGQALAASLDWEQTLVQVARLAVPALADWCIVDVLEEDGVTIKQVAVAAADPRKEELLREMRTLYPPTIDSPQPAARTLRSGEPAVFADFGPAERDATTRDERHVELIRELDPKSAIAVPMLARARTIGALTLAWSESGRRYTEARDRARDRAREPCRAGGRQRDSLLARARGPRDGRGGRGPVARPRGDLAGGARTPRHELPPAGPAGGCAHGDGDGHRGDPPARRDGRRAGRLVGARARGGSRGPRARARREGLRGPRRRDAPAGLHPRRRAGRGRQPAPAEARAEVAARRAAAGRGAACSA